MRLLPVILLCAAGFVIPAAQAESAASYCNEMYPSESYEADERSEYIRDCMAAYGEETTEEVSEQAPETEEYDGTDKYYDRTVEEYVDSVDTETDPGNEEQEPSEYDTYE